ncbi:MAG: GGDEF and EAL domain-containing protein [Salaquimonas sp.]|nr:GGDEF and EAL domain-containing protein [Salaquimonas sp.]
MDARQLLALTGQASYIWDIASDRIEWSDNFAGLVGFVDELRHSNGREFEKLIQAEGSQSRFGHVVGSANEAEPDSWTHYQCIYAIAAQHVPHGEPIWLEDTGAWQAGGDGRPQRAEGVVRIISDRRRREEKLRRRSDYDDLTGLANRRYLEWQIGEVLKLCKENNDSAALLVISLDRLEIVNDYYGFAVGDEVIRQCSERIATRTRGDDLVARFSGAKFGVILRKCSSREIHAASRRFLNALQSKFVETSAGPVTPNISIGACLLPRHAATVREAVAHANSACKSARHHSGFRIKVHEPDFAARQCKRKSAALATALAAACEEGSLRLAFQPVVEALSGRTAFHECLVRMDNGPEGAANGGHIVSIASQLGFIGTLDHRSLELTLETLAANRQAHLSLNVSMETAADPLWLSKLANGVQAIAGSAERLIVEITESHAADDLAEAGKFISVLHSLGCKVAIDDFGAGFTSFSNLKTFLVDMIKIDGSFAANLVHDVKDQVFVKSLIDIAKVCGAGIVVEWVEDVQTADLLAEWGADYLQGHLFGEAGDRLSLAPAEPLRRRA